MLQNIKRLYGCRLVATDGPIGKIKDFYFDDQSWVIRYLVADTGTWLTGRQVLLSPYSFGIVDEYEKTLHLKLHKKQIENGPPIESHQPVSRQYEIEYYNYYGWPAYWDGGALWGFGSYPMVVPPPNYEAGPRKQTALDRNDKHLQSSHAVLGYQLRTLDGEIGQVSGFMVDDRSWAIEEVVVKTGDWHSGKEILLSTEKVKRVSYENSELVVECTKADIQQTAEHHLVRAAQEKQEGELSPAD